MLSLCCRFVLPVKSLTINICCRVADFSDLSSISCVSCASSRLFYVFAAIRQPVIVAKPVVQQKSRRVRHAPVSTIAPRLHLLADARHSRRGGNFCFQKPDLGRVGLVFAWHGMYQAVWARVSKAIRTGWPALPVAG